MIQKIGILLVTKENEENWDNKLISQRKIEKKQLHATYVFLKGNKAIIFYKIQKFLEPYNQNLTI